ncbi:MAG: MMPL family transporter, partial [Pseudomonadales bacterium]
VVFGSLVMVLIVLLLIFFFRRFRWVVLPLLISGVSILITTGILAFAGKPVTVVSSNFIALLAIICISFSIHLIVRYRELLTDDPEINHRDLVIDTMESKFAPCLYTGLTTMLAFGAMLASRIVPVEDFGWMMCLGIVISFFVTYTLFPAALLVLGKGVPSSTLGNRIELTRLLSRLCVDHSKKVLAVSLLIVLIAAGGLTRVSFDNRFVDYFAEETDIYAGMVYIDQHLGGTLPFDIYLDLGEYEGYEGDEADPFAAPTEETWPERYWFTRDRIETVAAVHEKLVAHAETGKVISISTLERLARQFNDGEPLSNLEMAYALGQLPAGVREQLVEPYAKPKAGYANINARIKESGPRFSRTELIEDIRSYATGDLGLEADRVIVTGMMVLFDDMLKQLADSQRQTLLYVVLATFVMFALLLRSPLLALLALIPNVIAAATVIAVMGYANIPLDMMTITIAAICIGIGVDDAIHYSHRFKAEFQDDKTVAQAVEAAHRTIGRAMYFTSTIIIGGFSILTFSNFLPTVYFGSLTALAMLLALLANLTLLPSLLIRFYRKP